MTCDLYAALLLAVFPSRSIEGLTGTGVAVGFVSALNPWRMAVLAPLLGWLVFDAVASRLTDGGGSEPLQRLAGFLNELLPISPWMRVPTQALAGWVLIGWLGFRLVRAVVKLISTVRPRRDSK